MTKREKMMQKVRMYNFALADAALFLDGHPKDTAARAYHNKVRGMYDEAVKEYESNFGPLNMMHVDNMARWTWIDDPWPWEGVVVKKYLSVA